jgi:ribosomal protein L9
MSIVELTRHIDGFYESMNKSNKFLGIGKGKDGKLDMNEVVAGLKKRGCELDKETIDLGKKRRAEFYGAEDICYNEISVLDANKDNRVSIQEIRATLNEQQLKIADQYGLDIGLFCKVNVVFDNFIKTKER